MFYGLFPPEVNSGMFDLGPGPIAFGLAAAEWGVLATALAAETAAASAQIAASVAVWSGGAPVSYQIASARVLQWLTEAQAVAQKNALSCIGVVQAWMAARMTMVPLPLVIANRTAATAAEATTIAAAAAGPIGAPVAASSAATAAQLEAQYAAMWAGDAITMNAYDVAVKIASTPLIMPPPPIVNAGAIGTESFIRSLGTIAAATLQGAPVQNALSKAAPAASQAGQAMAGVASQAASVPAQAASAASSTMGRTISDNEFNRLLREKGLDPNNYAAPNLGQMADFAGAGGGANGGGMNLGTGAGADDAARLGVTPIPAFAGAQGTEPSSVFPGVAMAPLATPLGAGVGSPMGTGMVPPMAPHAQQAKGKIPRTTTADVLRAHPEFGPLQVRESIPVMDADSGINGPDSVGLVAAPTEKGGADSHSSHV